MRPRTHPTRLSVPSAVDPPNGERSGAGAAGWWKLARKQALIPEQVESPLARRAYDLRHAAASLLRVYANCIDGGEDGLHDRIGGALGWPL
ncbi:hypothetical protein J2S43_007622 [Catenuloplanes nepalensis]|uniref:Uncharacterized protein n=1 Tax=Catenuloplanes nepalensis TaxID=587533 RepID=A0ABT9N6D4_9ACTN|nr:hypothetical protein [Catenuloplanes nepalensis]